MRAGIVSALGVSFVAKFFFWREDPTPPFMLELPDYKLPRPRSVAIGLLSARACSCSAPAPRSSP